MENKIHGPNHQPVNIYTHLGHLGFPFIRSPERQHAPRPARFPAPLKAPHSPLLRRPLGEI